MEESQNREATTAPIHAVTVDLQAKLKLSANIMARVATHLSMSHIQSAALFARQCHAIEQMSAEPVSDDIIAEHRAYVTGAIFHSTAFLEATINELYEAAASSFPTVSKLGAPIIRDMSVLWNHAMNVNRSYRTLEKFQIALDLAGKPRYSEKGGKAPPAQGSYADIEHLIILRNALMHYKLLWEGHPESKGVPNLRDILKSRFATCPNPFMATNSHFLDRYLGHACAMWAEEASLMFADDFFSRLGLVPPYEHLRTRLNAKA